MIGSVVTKPAVESWYPTLRKPAFVPPNWVFPVAWTTLYADIAVTSAMTVDGLQGVLTASSVDLARRTAQVDSRAGAALSAYPAWCAFATALSTSTWWLNRDR